jgi:predicted kinase
VHAGWTSAARRVGIGSAAAMLAIGILYLATIALWLLAESTPLEPIGDPFLAVMEVLTLFAGAALVGFLFAVSRFADPPRRAPAFVALVLGAAATALTTTVHFVQLTAVRQLWRAGARSDYRLVWPSSILAVEYLAWDVLVGGAMLLASVALAGGPGRRGARRVMLLGGALCLMGIAGPASGRMLLQDLALAGYAVLLPIGCALTSRAFFATAPGPDHGAPTLYVLSGLPGTGKSTLARLVARRLDAFHLRIDTIEQGLRDLCSFEVQGEGYRLAYRIASDNLRVGLSVIADSCNPIALTRREWEETAREAGAECVNIEVVCSDAGEHRARVEARATETPDPTLPTWSDVTSRTYEDWAADRVVIDTAGRPAAACANELLSKLRRPPAEG